MIARKIWKTSLILFLGAVLLDYLANKPALLAKSATWRLAIWAGKEPTESFHHSATHQRGNKSSGGSKLVGTQILGPLASGRREPGGNKSHSETRHGCSNANGSRSNTTGSFLFMHLPSGRKIAYPFPRLKTHTRGDCVVVFMDNDKGKWVECRGGQGAYGGIWIENAVQAIVMDLFAAAMPTL